MEGINAYIAIHRHMDIAAKARIKFMNISAIMRGVFSVEAPLMDTAAKAPQKSTCMGMEKTSVFGADQNPRVIAGIVPMKNIRNSL